MISFLQNRQYGMRRTSDVRADNYRLNLDHVISRLTCYTKNFHSDMQFHPYACKFRKDSRCDLLAVGNVDGHVTLHDTSDEAFESMVGSIYVHDTDVIDMCWLPDKCQLIACSGNRVTLLDMCQLQVISSFMNGTRLVTAVDVCYEQSAIFAVGTENGSVNVWDTRESNAKPQISIRYAHSKTATSTVNRKLKNKVHRCGTYITGVAFQDSTTLASCSDESEYIRLWDLRKICVSNQPSPKYQMKYGKPCLKDIVYTSIVFDSTYKNLYACRGDSQILKFDCYSYNKVDAIYTGRYTHNYEQIALSCDDQYLLCSSSDRNAYIWNTSNPRSPILSLPHKTIPSVCWSPYNCTKLAACGFDGTLAIWKVSNLDNDDDIGVTAKAERYEDIDIFGDFRLLNQDTDQTLVTDSSTNQMESPEVIQTTTEPSVHVQNSVTDSNTNQRESPEVIQTTTGHPVQVRRNLFSPEIPSLSNKQLFSEASASPNTSNDRSSENLMESHEFTTNKSSVHTIIKVFSTLTPHSSNLQCSPKTSIASNEDITPKSENVLLKLQIRNSESYRILSPSNVHRSPHQILEESDVVSQTLEELKNVTSCHSVLSSYLEDKDNIETAITPESLSRANSLGQKKRKLTSIQSVPSSKHSQPGSNIVLVVNFSITLLKKIDYLKKKLECSFAKSYQL